ncbi:FAD-dependent monooxygenase [Bacteriovoracaceae bacterium]|nr:FAD-dependent monooxygenase [Bacteriovoracaceae bacterium]
MDELVAISGGGLVGPALALELKRKHSQKIKLFEKRSDIRKSVLGGGRSINLIITAKGQKVLADLCLLEDIKPLIRKVTGRAIHDIKGNITYQPYGRNETECNWSISRLELNKLLLKKLDEADIPTFFETEVISVDSLEKKAEFSTNGSSQMEEFDIFLAADGVHSNSRKSLVKASQEHRYEPLGVGYKELTMQATESGEYALEPDYLHIWPRGSQMLMALPNNDSSFTMTLYMPEEDFIPFGERENAEGKAALLSYFEGQFPDAFSLMSELVKEFFHNETGRLGTLYCYPWVFNGNAGLIGDAAHAIVPFYGQGMNLGLNDISVLSTYLEKTGNWKEALGEYEEHQKKNADAMAKMSIENFQVMCNAVGEKKYHARKAIEQKLESHFPDTYRSQYGLVTYTLVDYYHAFEIGLLQERMIDYLSLSAELNFSDAKDLIEKNLVPYYKKHSLSLNSYRPV